MTLGPNLPNPWIWTTHAWSRQKIRTILDSDEIAVIPQSHESFQGGPALYERRPDKKYSLTDCITMNVMRREGITEILTNDHHFAQEGFRRLMSRREVVREE